MLFTIPQHIIKFYICTPVCVCACVCMHVRMRVCFKILLQNCRILKQKYMYVLNKQGQRFKIIHYKYV